MDNKEKGTLMMLVGILVILLPICGSYLLVMVNHRLKDIGLTVGVAILIFGFIILLKAVKMMKRPNKP